MGEKVIATVCGTNSELQRPQFKGKNVRGIRRHYAWLRKRLGNKKLLKKIKDISAKESNKVSTMLHEISKEIVSLAVASNSAIFLGDLKGIGGNKKKGKRFNRIVNHMPHFKLTQYIEYKAKWEGIKVIKISEKNTSRTCSECGYCDKKNRKKQGLFNCLECNYQVNADFNGAKNILDRGLDYMSKSGALAYAQKNGMTVQAR